MVAWTWQSATKRVWGEPFISNVRVDWITLRERREGSWPLIVNVLGADDELVAREDAIDLLQDPDARHVNIPGATHDTVIHPTPRNHLLLIQAFVGEPLPRDPMPRDRYNPAAPIRRVYMLMHGMRSSKHFLLELGEALERRGSSPVIAG